tara:strand:+ start:4716 stop:5009 length:294 start_codon:yes stop_codon:yes gene_type:complete
VDCGRIGTSFPNTSGIDFDIHFLDIESIVGPGFEDESVRVACVPFQSMSIPNAWVLVFTCLLGRVLCSKATREGSKKEEEGDCPHLCTPPHRAAEEE